MANLVLWVAAQDDDSPCYNLIGKTRTSVLEQMAQRPYVQYQPPRKVVVPYKDAFDLFDWATSEAGGRGAL